MAKAHLGAGAGTFAGGYVMFIVVALPVALLWQYFVAAILIFLLVLLIRRVTLNARAMPPAVHHPPKRVKTPKAIEAKPEPKPAPEYVPRWDKSRRKDARRELAQWQELFDTHAV